MAVGQDAGLDAWETFHHAHAAIVRELDGELEHRHGLSLSSYSVLRALRSAPDGRLRMADLAQHVQLSRSGMTRLVDRLEAQGALRRCSCEDDARGCFAVLTERGAQIADAAGATYSACISAALPAIRGIAANLTRAH